MGRRQHYVPQFYLRRFSNDGRTVKVFSVSKNRVEYENAPIKTQSYERYFYGDDGKAEKILSEMESIWSQLISRIIKNERIPKITSEDYYFLLRFVLLQLGRTKYMATDFEELLDASAKSTMQTIIELNKGKADFLEGFDVDRIKIEINNPGYSCLLPFIFAHPLMTDLRCKIIINRTAKQFVTSDNPIILYDKMFINGPWGFIGLECKGLIILYPVSPEYYIAHFDPVIYKFGGRKTKTPVIITRDSDIDEINTLQYINSNRVIYANNNTEIELKRIAESGFNYRKGLGISFSESEPYEVDGEIRQLTITERNKIKYDAELSFIKINKNIPFEYLTLDHIRNKELFISHNKFIDKLWNGAFHLND